MARAGRERRRWIRAGRTNGCKPVTLPTGAPLQRLAARVRPEVGWLGDMVTSRRHAQTVKIISAPPAQVHFRPEATEASGQGERQAVRLLLGLQTCWSRVRSKQDPQPVCGIAQAELGRPSVGCSQQGSRFQSCPTSKKDKGLETRAVAGLLRQQPSSGWLRAGQAAERCRAVRRPMGDDRAPAPCFPARFSEILPAAIGRLGAAATPSVSVSRARGERWSQKGSRGASHRPQVRRVASGPSPKRFSRKCPLRG